MLRFAPSLTRKFGTFLVPKFTIRDTSAFSGAREIGIDNLAGMCEVVLSLVPRNFYKSMTTHADHRIWQDVYHAKSAIGVGVYLKLTVIDELLIISFKEQ